MNKQLNIEPVHIVPELIFFFNLLHFFIFPAGFWMFKHPQYLRVIVTF